MLQQTHPPVSALVAQGLQSHQRGDLVGAEHTYLAIMQREPGNADALHLLGVLKGQQGLHATGIELIEQAIAGKPRVSAYHNNLGNLWTKAGDPANAEKSYRRALRVDKNNADAHLNLGKLLQTRSLIAEARGCFISSLRIAPRCVETHMSLGRLEEAANKTAAALQSYRNAARIAPDYAPAHLGLGNVYKALDELDQAAESYRAAIAADEKYADAHFNLANVLRSQGKTSEAVSLYRTAAKLSPTNASDIHNNLGLALSELGQEKAALASLLQAVTIASTSDEGWFNLGKQAARVGDWDAAEGNFRKAISFNSKNAQAHLELGNVCHASGRLDEAVKLYREAIRLSPTDASAFNNLGATLADLDLHEEAQAAYREAIALRPDYYEAYFNLGKDMSMFGDEEAGMQMLRHAVSLNPKYAPAHNQIGVVWQNRGYLEQAAKSYLTSLDLDGSSTITRSNLGLVLAQLGDTQGLDLLEAAVREQPLSPADHWSWSEKLLLHGRYEQGLEEYEWRMRVDQFATQHRAFTQPRWNGEPLEGKTILLYAEQGQGDTLQFARYAKLVADRGGRVILEVQPSLRRLLEGMPGVWQCIEQGAPLPEFSMFAPLMSLPYIMSTQAETIPEPVYPALSLTQTSHPQRATTLQVGLVWAGNAKDKRDRLRSTRLTQWAGLASIEGVSFTSLQAGEAASQAKDEGHPFNFVEDCSEVKDFADTAAIIEQLDLIITVDTAVAHLAGTMGKPVWILVYKAGDWRWGLHSSETAWYPTARLFRQTKAADWSDVFSEVEQSLRKLVSMRAISESSSELAA